MKRREFITLVGGAAVAALGPARAEADRVRHIGILMGYAESDPDTQARMTAFREAFEQLGWREATTSRSPIASASARSSGSAATPRNWSIPIRT